MTIISIVDVIMFVATLIVGGGTRYRCVFRLRRMYSTSHVISLSRYFFGQIVNYDGAFVSSNNMGGPSSATLYHMGGKWEPDIKYAFLLIILSLIRTRKCTCWQPLFIWWHPLLFSSTISHRYEF